MVDCGEVDAEQFECIRSLNERLKQMSGPANAPLWTEDAVLNSPEWDQIRNAAKRCLSLLSDKRSWFMEKCRWTAHLLAAVHFSRNAV